VQGDPLAKLPNPKHDYSGKTDVAVHIPEKSQANVKARRPSMVPEESKTIKETRVPKDGIASFSRAKTFDRQRIVEQLIEAAPRVLVDCEDNYFDTPFRARLYSKLQGSEDVKLKTAAEVDADEVHRHKTIENDSILLYMRKYIIEKFTRRDAMTALYELGDGKTKIDSLTAMETDTKIVVTRAGVGIRSYWSATLDN
jgi:hypothetical protein